MITTLPRQTLALAPLLVIPLFAVVGCAGQPTRLETTPVQSQAMHTEMHYAVWAPADHRPDERLPLVVFLHGGGDDHQAFDRHGIGPSLDAALAAGEIPRVIIVLPEGHMGFWANWRDGSRYYEDWVVYEVMPAVERDYHTAACPEDCHVMGVSMGGAGTMRFVFHHPELFASAGVISAPIMNTDAMLAFTGNRLYQMLFPTHRIWGSPPRAQVEVEDPFVQWRSQDDLPVRLYLAWAEDDREMIVTGNSRFGAHLAQHGIDHAGGAFPGGHNWVSWEPVIIDALATNVRSN